MRKKDSPFLRYTNSADSVMNVVRDVARGLLPTSHRHHHHWYSNYRRHKKRLRLPHEWRQFWGFRHSSFGGCA
ncbi:Uncharacterised protein [Vibrio cholerae]|nr:Uncharacterised protein [Vibrio cholerae]CSC49813.1 Uncharacterised protein [Vibrio cholerae]CSI49219.1 Uncharacterised protein [Vibrio cholerae]